MLQRPFIATSLRSMSSALSIKVLAGYVFAAAHWNYYDAPEKDISRAVCKKVDVPRYLATRSRNRSMYVTFARAVLLICTHDSYTTAIL